jgi:Cu/Zn superoxide dismutase
MGFTASADRGIVPGGPGRRVSWRLRLAAGAVSAALAGAAALPMAGTASASPGGADSSSEAETLTLNAMPHGTVTFHRERNTLLARVVMYGLTPGSSHAVDLLTPGLPGIIPFSPFTVNNSGGADKLLASSYSGPWKPGSRLVIRMGTERNPVAHAPIAETARLQSSGAAMHRLISVEVSSGGVSYGTPRGRATISYNSVHHTLTVTVHASGLTPGPHAAHIHLGSCESQGPVLYMLADLVANSQGRVVDAVRVLTNVTTPIPAHGWYLNIHQGNSENILNKGNPTIYFRPLLCANIHGWTLAS